MINHLGSKEHKTTLDLLYDKVESHFFSAGGEKRERSRGKKETHVELHHAKMLVDLELPLNIVEKMPFMSWCLPTTKITSQYSVRK
jgi:hypothetical protein